MLVRLGFHRLQRSFSVWPFPTLSRGQAALPCPHRPPPSPPPPALLTAATAIFLILPTPSDPLYHPDPRQIPLPIRASRVCFKPIFSLVLFLSPKSFLLTQPLPAVARDDLQNLKEHNAVFVFPTADPGPSLSLCGEWGPSSQEHSASSPVGTHPSSLWSCSQPCSSAVDLALCLW